MVFRRRTKRNFWQVLLAIFYPKGGWRRAASYVGHRLSRLPDTPERIAMGIAAGVFASFTPLFGLHFILAAVVARVFGGNILASLLSTFFGNPITFPIIAMGSVELGNWILGQGGIMHFPQIMASFGMATAELWANFVAIFTGGEQNWHRLTLFFWRVFLPYLLGGFGPGLLFGVAFYYGSLPLVRAYQSRRREAMRRRFALSRAAAQVQAGQGGAGASQGPEHAVRRGSAADADRSTPPSGPET